jgi:hypothetical protein
MSGVLGERSVSASKPPPPPSSAIKSKNEKGKNFVKLEEGGSKVVSFMSESKSEDDGEGPLTSSVSVVGLGESGKQGGGGVRVSARVTACDDENDQIRFYLETEEEELKHPLKTTLTDCVMGLVGRKLMPGKEDQDSELDPSFVEPKRLYPSKNSLKEGQTEEAHQFGTSPFFCILTKN